MYKKIVISIEGNIGAGKSTLLKCLSKVENTTVLPEPVEKWTDVRRHNLFGLCMDNPMKWAFPFQCLALQTLLDNHVKEITTPIKIMERSAYSGRNCFIKLLTQNGTIHPVQEAVLEEWYQFIKRTFPIGLDLIIYTRVSPDVALQRIQARNRPGEANVKREYLENLHDLHEEWLNRDKCPESGATIRIIDVDMHKEDVELEAQKLSTEITQLSLFT